MTGTPITNELSDVFTQCLFFDGGKLFGTSFWRFRQIYYLQSGPGWYLKQGAKERITQKLYSAAFHIKIDDVIKLPETRRFVKAAPLSGQQRRHCKQILEEWEVQLSTGETIELNHVVTQLLKLRQVASGFVYDSNHQPVWIKASKLKLLKELLTSDDYFANKPKIVVWCSHVAEMNRIHKLVTEELKDKSVLFTGSKKMEARKLFYSDKSVRFFIGQVDSGVGMNELIVADTAIYFSNSFKVSSRQQSEARIRRKGSGIHSAITYLDLVSEKSIDEHILRSIRNKVNLADFILAKLQNQNSILDILA